jgi:hypothetical protein
MIRFAALTLEEMCDRLGDDKADAPILDGHNHVVLPPERHVALLDEGGVSRAMLLVARPHPERATDLAGFRQEMAALSQTVSGAQNVGDSVRPAMAQLHETISLYPDQCLRLGANGDRRKGTARDRRNQRPAGSGGAVRAGAAGCVRL